MNASRFVVVGACRSMAVVDLTAAVIALRRL